MQDLGGRNLEPSRVHLYIGIVYTGIKEHKAYGPDKIPNCLLKECATEIAPSLVLLFQASIKQSKVPSE